MVSADLRSVSALPMASSMRFSRASMPARIGFQANFARMKKSARKVRTVSTVAAGSNLSGWKPSPSSARASSGAMARFMERLRVRCARVSAREPSARPGVASRRAARPDRTESLADGQREDQAHDHGEQRDALDEGGRDDHAALDVARGLRLARDAFHRRGRETPDAGATAHDGETRAETGAQTDQTHTVHSKQPPECPGRLRPGSRENG